MDHTYFPEFLNDKLCPSHTWSNLLCNRGQLPRDVFLDFAWIISLWEHIMCRAEEQFLGVTFSVSRGFLTTGSCGYTIEGNSWRMFFIHNPVNFGGHNPGGSCIIKKRMTVCHRLYTNVWLASVISNGLCLAVNPLTPPTCVFIHRENVSLPHRLPSCLSFSEQMVNTSLMPCLSVCLCCDAAQSLGATRRLNISHWQRGPAFPNHPHKTVRIILSLHLMV